MAKIRGNKYISVEERKALDDISEARNANVSLGSKLYELTEQLASEIEGEPISESFPKSVHDLEDHTGIPGVGGEGITEEEHALINHTGIEGCGGAAEVFTQEVHDLEDHSSLPGIPSVTGLLDETAHDLLDHTGLTGVPAAEAFTKDVHDLEDHGSIPGIPSIAGLLDETAHDALDHAGLTGIPDTTGLLDETAHDALDHTGLTGVPSITGLLDEADHDVLDHSGLPGIPVVPITLKESVVNIEALPVNTDITLLDEQTGYTAGNSIYDYITGGQKAAVSFVGDGENDYFIDCSIIGGSPSGGALRAFIYSNNAGNPDAELFASDELTSGNVASGEVLSFRFHFTNINLVDGTTYFVVFCAVSGKTNICSNNHSGANHKFYYTFWSAPGFGLFVKVSRAGIVNSYENDIRYVEDVHKLYVFDGINWLILPEEAFTSAVHATTDHSGLTGIPSITWRGTYANAAALPSAADDGDSALVLDDGASNPAIYNYTTSWAKVGNLS